MHYILSYRHTRYVKAIERQSSFVACCSSLVARRSSLWVCPARSMLGKGRRIASHMKHQCDRRRKRASGAYTIFCMEADCLLYDQGPHRCLGIQNSGIVVAKTSELRQFVVTIPPWRGGVTFHGCILYIAVCCDEYLAWPT